MPISKHLGRVVDCGQFFIYRLTEWDGSKWRRKQPWGDGHVVSPSNPSNWTSYASAAARAASLPANSDVEWAVGLWITDDLNLFFIDIDRLPADYTLDADATAILQQFPGCLTEWSSSKRGLHIIGSRTGPVRHSKRAGRLELYTDERGIALSSIAAGSADTVAHDALQALIDRSFPPADVATRGVVITLPPGAQPELGALSLALRQADKIATARDGERNATLNTAAYTLGGMVGAGRITREDARAALIRAVERAQWGDMPTQVSKIDQALTAGMEEPIAAGGVPATATGTDTSGADWYTLTDDAISAVNNTGTFKELMERVVPDIGGLGLPQPHAERVVRALSKRLELFDAKLPIGSVRQLVTPPQAVTTSDAPPEWFAPFCYVRRTETYYNTYTGTHFTADNFRTEFSRYMPMRANSGLREDPVQYARERWNVPTVDDTVYRPDCEVFFDSGGKQFANEYLPSSLPVVTTPSEDCVAAIQAFQNHLYLICGMRDDLYITLLQWIAHNVQFPGRKIRWSPIIKGIPGDGKSIVSDLMRAALGLRNVKMTSISNLSNSGGFTDWATGAAVNFIEEIQLTGRERYRLFNAMKTYIADNYIDLNRKGRAAGDTVYNVTNHWANTNYGDALPLDDGDRRWCVVFTPYTTIKEAAAAKGLASADDLVGHFKWLGTSMRTEPGAWRGWLMGIDLSSFEPDGRAPNTSEKTSMKLMSQDALDQAVSDVLEQGGIGITDDVFCSKSLMGMVGLKVDERPATRTWNALLTRLGYQQHEKLVWWNGTSQRVWTKKPMSGDEIKEILNKTIK